MNIEPGNDCLSGRLEWQRAIDLASRRHEGQYRRNGVTPYASHPLRVAMVISSVFGIQDGRILAAAAMHDLIEDTTVDFDEIAEYFDEEIASWVAAVSKDMRLPESQREQAYDQRLAQSPWQARLIKLADVYDNLSDTVQPDEIERFASKARRAMEFVGDEPELQQAATHLAECLHTIEAGTS